MGTVTRKSPRGSAKTRPSKSARAKPTTSAAKSKGKRPPPRQQKTKPAPVVPRKKRVYSAEELGIPKLNMITPVGVQKPQGKKKGKVFVDDKESMMTILAMVNADKEGQLESKIMKARQLEEIREARKAEQEARQQARKSKLEVAKDQVRQERKRKKRDLTREDFDDTPRPSDAVGPTKRKKRVSFK